MKGSYICDRCNKSLASRQSLWNHRQRCKFSKSNDSYKELLPRHINSNSTRFDKKHHLAAIKPFKARQDTSIQTCSPFFDITKPTKKENPRIQALIDAVINDGITDDSTVENEPPPLKMKKMTSVKEINKVTPSLSLQVNDQDESDVDEAERDVDDGNCDKTLCEECQLDEMVEEFRKLYYELVNEGRRENVPELLDILCIWRDAAQIDQEQYKKFCMKINAISMKDNVYSSDESLTDDAVDDDDDHPLLDASAIKRLHKRFKLLHYDLINKGHTDNAPILRGLLDILKGEGEINQEEYEKGLKAVTDYCPH